MSTALDQADGSCDASRQAAVWLGDRADADEFNRGSTLEDDLFATLNTIQAVEDTVRAADHVIAAAEKVYDITRYAVSPVVVESRALQASMAPDMRAEARAGLLIVPRLRWGRLALCACAAVVMTLSLARDELPVPNVAGLSWFARLSPDPAGVEPPDTVDRQSAPAQQAAAVELAASETDAAPQPDAAQRKGTAEVNSNLPIQAAPPADNPPAGVSATSEAIRSEAPHVVVRQLDIEQIALLRKRGEELLAAGNIAAARLPLRRAAEAAVVRQLDLEQIALLCKRGEEFLAVGDIAAARLPLRRAAEARDARSALLLARTYDPILLGKLGAHGLAPDVALARLWYQRANELGAAEASERLHMLAQWGR